MLADVHEDQSAEAFSFDMLVSDSVHWHVGLEHSTVVKYKVGSRAKISSSELINFNNHYPLLDTWTVERESPEMLSNRSLQSLLQFQNASKVIDHERFIQGIPAMSPAHAPTPHQALEFLHTKLLSNDIIAFKA